MKNAEQIYHLVLSPEWRQLPDANAAIAQIQAIIGPREWPSDLEFDEKTEEIMLSKEAGHCGLCVGGALRKWLLSYGGE